jgi:hypothetical protein
MQGALLNVDPESLVGAWILVSASVVDRLLINDFRASFCSRVKIKYRGISLQMDRQWSRISALMHLSDLSLSSLRCIISVVFVSLLTRTKTLNFFVSICLFSAYR